VWGLREDVRKLRSAVVRCAETKAFAVEIVGSSWLVLIGINLSSFF
jgi:hypothetical protein